MTKFPAWLRVSYIWPNMRNIRYIHTFRGLQEYCQIWALLYPNGQIIDCHCSTRQHQRALLPATLADGRCARLLVQTFWSSASVRRCQQIVLFVHSNSLPLNVRIIFATDSSRNISRTFRNYSAKSIFTCRQNNPPKSHKRQISDLYVDTFPRQAIQCLLGFSYWFSSFDRTKPLILV